MRSHAKLIVENLSATEYAELSVDFLIKITNESERGAVLVGATEVDKYLEKLITKILPEQSKSYKSRILNYPGPLSSFAGKLEMLYAFRIIDPRLYQSLNTLRRIRNDAAHSSKLFSIQSIQEKLNSIYDFEDGFADIANKLAFNYLIKHKIEVLKKGINESGLNDLDHELLWKEHIPSPENEPTIMEHLTIWKFAIGLVFLCLKIEAVTLDFSVTSETSETTN